jgi:hypothetical protein
MMPVLKLETNVGGNMKHAAEMLGAKNAGLICSKGGR